MTEEKTTTTTEERAVPCFVRHEDAGGQCGRPAAMRVHGLAFCRLHGEEARSGAAVEEYQEVYNFLTRFRNPEVPGHSTPIDRALEIRPGLLAGSGPFRAESVIRNSSG